MDQMVPEQSAADPAERCVVSTARGALTTLRTMPVVFRASIALLFVAATAGQLTQHRSAGPQSKAMLVEAAHACPAVALPLAKPTVGDAERTLDQAMRRMILDQLIPQTPPRCGGSSERGGIRRVRHTGRSRGSDRGHPPARY